MGKPWNRLVNLCLIFPNKVEIWSERIPGTSLEPKKFKSGNLLYFQLILGWRIYNNKNKQPSKNV